MTKRDLFVVVADLDAENVLRTLLTERRQALGVSFEFDPDQDLLRYNKRDPGCYRDAAAILRSALTTHRHALLCFDWHGSGAESKQPDQIQDEIEADLVKNGWEPGAVAVVVFAPELEAWLWSDSPHVAETLGWRGDREALSAFLLEREFLDKKASKLAQPKEAMSAALHRKRKPLSAALFKELAARVALRSCADPAFRKFTRVLQTWFPI